MQVERLCLNDTDNIYLPPIHVRHNGVIQISVWLDFFSGCLLNKRAILQTTSKVLQFVGSYSVHTLTTDGHVWLTWNTRINYRVNWPNRWFLQVVPVCNKNAGYQPLWWAYPATNLYFYLPSCWICDRGHAVQPASLLRGQLSPHVPELHSLQSHHKTMSNFYVSVCKCDKSANTTKIKHKLKILHSSSSDYATEQKPATVKMVTSLSQHTATFYMSLLPS